MRRLLAPLFTLPATGLTAALLFTAGPAAAAAPVPPDAGTPSVSVRDCVATGGVPMADGEGRYWCVGGVYTGVRVS